MNPTTPNSIDNRKAADLQRIHDYLVNALMSALECKSSQHFENAGGVENLLEEIYQKTQLKLPDEQKRSLFQDVINETFRYGPIQDLIDDPTISEILITGPKQVYIERNGELRDTGIQFENDEHVSRLIDRIISPLGRWVDREHPMVDARLPDGSRVNIVIPPVAIDGPTLSIRKFLKNKLTVDEFIHLGSITRHMADFLRACVLSRLNILITGNTSSGKTTLLNILSGFIPDNERVITIEDAAELQLTQKYIVRLETRQASFDGPGEVTTRDLVRNALRMRPDRIIVGECRSGEALDMLQAMNTGHNGSITTLHANSPRDAIARLETMALMAGIEIPILAVRKQVASAIDLIVHMARMEDGSRKITYITEVAGMESDVVTLSDIFKFERTGTGENGKVLGELKPTRIRPMFTPKLEAAGFRLGGEIFGAGKY